MESRLIKLLVLLCIWPPYANKPELMEFLLEYEGVDPIDTLAVLEKYFNFKEKKLTPAFENETDAHLQFLYYLYHHTKNKFITNNPTFTTINNVVAKQIAKLLNLMEISGKATDEKVALLVTGKEKLMQAMEIPA